MPIINSKLSLMRSIVEVTAIWALNRSKDPSTKVGACIYDHATGGLFLGYNGFPIGIEDDEELWNCRDSDKLNKYDLVIHAEANAINKALKAGVDFSNAVLYCTHLPCPRCLRDVILANGIPQVYFSISDYNSVNHEKIEQIIKYSNLEVFKIDEEKINELLYNN